MCALLFCALQGNNAARYSYDGAASRYSHWHEAPRTPPFEDTEVAPPTPATPIAPPAPVLSDTDAAMLEADLEQEIAGLHADIALVCVEDSE